MQEVILEHICASLRCLYTIQNCDNSQDLAGITSGFSLLYSESKMEAVQDAKCHEVAEKVNCAYNILHCFINHCSIVHLNTNKVIETTVDLYN